MRLHRGHQDFARHFEKCLFERAHQHDGPFGQAGVLGKQRFVLDEFELRFFGERMRLL